MQDIKLMFLNLTKPALQSYMLQIYHCEDKLGGLTKDQIIEN